ncbi:hypothetical protein BBBOND_0211680 [Babesia bigemina]|uniref:Uncharacterized protein n=1 Tax=Babesia bigemina TaxID=5866 RepID=A0A061D5M3_BABBI|nr:hypothetical protein BBBOND_0211680 [Babesia bigemina]CDR96026.1 hypothetical protein BBBOND_0211680 [Babesia bigemina]|eukprot:XP_012768212.1 hypothetical protein BBBOND_0211680 [Babesia bigemina]
MDDVHARLSEDSVLKISAQNILDSVEDALRIPEHAVNGVQRFQELTLQLYLRADLAPAWTDLQKKANLLKQPLIESFRDTCVLLLNRYPEAHCFLIK